MTGVDRKTIRRYAAAVKLPRGGHRLGGPGRANSPTPATGFDRGIRARRQSGSAAPRRASRTAPGSRRRCELGRNAVSIYQDLVEAHGFTHAYNSVKRFVATLKARAPERFDVLEFLPGEEAQVDYGQGALTLVRPGKYRRPYLFVMTLKYSGKSFRKVGVEDRARRSGRGCTRRPFGHFGGCPAVRGARQPEGRGDPARHLRPGVEPGVRRDARALRGRGRSVPGRRSESQGHGRERDPAHAGDRAQGAHGSTRSRRRTRGSRTGRSAGRRCASTGARSARCSRCTARSSPHLRPLPLEGFRYFKQGMRTVDDAGLVQVDGSYYAALPAAPHSEVTVRIYEREIEILDPTGQLLRRHEKAAAQGHSSRSSRRIGIFNPSRESRRGCSRKAERIGPHTAQPLPARLFARLGRPGQRAIYGLTNLAAPLPLRRHRGGVRAPARCAGAISYAAVKRALERTGRDRRPPQCPRSDPDRARHIRAHHRVPIVLGNPLPDSPTGGLRWQCLSLNSNDRCAHCASPA